MASTRRPPIASTLTDMMVCTASYWMALPALRELSAEVATCSKVATCLCWPVQQVHWFSHAMHASQGCLQLVQSLLGLSLHAVSL